jgi:hypothetical protein
MRIQQQDDEGRHVELSGPAERSRGGKRRLFISIYSSGRTANLVFTSIWLSNEEQEQLLNWLRQPEEPRA